MKAIKKSITKKVTKTVKKTVVTGIQISLEEAALLVVCLGDVSDNTAREQFKLYNPCIGELAEKVLSKKIQGKVGNGSYNFWTDLTNLIEQSVQK